MKQTQGKTQTQREPLSEKKAEKDVLVFAVHSLSPVRFNTPFNYHIVHLCKHPHPLLPELETHTREHMLGFNKRRLLFKNYYDLKNFKKTF